MKVRRRTFIVIVCLILAALVGLTALIDRVIIPSIEYRKADALVEEGQYLEAAGIFSVLGYFRDAPERVTESHYLHALQLLKAGRYDDAATVFSAMGHYLDSQTRYREARYSQALLLEAEGDSRGALLRFSQAGNYQDAQSRSQVLRAKYMSGFSISAGFDQTVAVRADGTVMAVGNPRSIDGVASWTDIIAVTAGQNFTAGLRADGTVLVAGDPLPGSDAREWTDLIALDAGSTVHLLGMKADGTVLSGGSVSGEEGGVSSWSNVLRLSAGAQASAALTPEGTILCLGGSDDFRQALWEWKDLADFVCTGDVLVGLRADGTVGYAGINDGTVGREVRKWTDIVAVAAGGNFVAGLRSDGTVVTAGTDATQYSTESWTDVVAISAGYRHLIGLRADGTLLAVGDNSDYRCETASWSGLLVPAEG